jgi:Reverse transcriptase (RNA-dependent DNA polymerase)
VDHGVLFRRLEDEFGIVGLCSQWVWSYLTDHITAVRVGNSTSAAATVLIGVARGSVLGPILYTPYVAPIGRLIESFGISFHHYANDTQFYTKLSIPTFNALDRLRQCTNALQHRFWQNGLLLNPDKSVVMYFGTRNRLQQTDLPLHVTTAWCDVTVSDWLTVLGVTLDSKLSMDHHVNNMVKNCNYHLQALRQIRSSVPRDVANTVACSVIHSRLDHCNSCQSTCLNST